MKNSVLILSLIGILSSCSRVNTDVNNKEFVPGEVFVGIKSGTDIQKVFNFINQVDLKVDNINSLTFTSDLPSDSLDYVLDVLNEKTYTNDGINWFVTGYLHHQTNKITIFPRLFDMENRDYQNDWLNSMEKLVLNEKHEIDLNSGIILFHVPPGRELEWKNKFENYNIIDWAELNFIADLYLNNE